MNGIAKTLLIAPWLLMLMAAPVLSVEVGDQVPDFTVRTFAGDIVSRATLQGHPALLIFWNTWCPNCHRELPKIDRLTESFNAKNLQVLAVNTAFNDSESKARAYWDKHRYPFPAGFDRTFETGQAFGIRGVPTIFLIDAAGVVRYKQAVLPANPEQYL